MGLYEIVKYSTCFNRGGFFIYLPLSPGSTNITNLLQVKKMFAYLKNFHYTSKRLNQFLKKEVAIMRNINMFNGSTVHFGNVMRGLCICSEDFI